MNAILKERNLKSAIQKKDILQKKLQLLDTDIKSMAGKLKKNKVYNDVINTDSLND